MHYRVLGRTDVEVSTVGMGCWAIVGDSTWGPQEERDSVAAIQAALDAGINFFDTAEGYGDGHSEQLLGRVLSDRRPEAVIASKVSPNHLRPEDLRASCEASLKRLRTDYIDVYQIHWPNTDIPIADTLAAMEQLKDEGKIRAIGCSNFGLRDLSELVACGRVEVNQLPYNLLWRAVEYEVQPLCVENQVSILAYSPLAQALLTGKFSSPDEVPEGRARTRHFSQDRAQTRHGEPGAEVETFAALEALRGIAAEAGEPMGNVALAWLLAQPAVASVLAGARNASQVRMNAAAGDLELSAPMLKRLGSVSGPLKEKLGRNLDMWSSESRIR